MKPGLTLSIRVGLEAAQKLVRETGLVLHYNKFVNMGLMQYTCTAIFMAAKIDYFEIKIDIFSVFRKT